MSNPTTAFSSIPPPEAIGHIPITSDTASRREPNTERQDSTSHQQLPSNAAAGNPDHTSGIPTASPSFGAGLPPVPSKLVKRIQDSEFTDMSELTIDCLSMSLPEETCKPSQSRRRPVTSIIEWTQCFTNYIAILTQAQPERTIDLLGYQHLILEAHLEYSGDGWAVYDRRFRQIATTRSGTPWARRDSDLWNMVFTSSQRRPYCQHCFSSTHSSEQCSGALDAPSRDRTTLATRPRKPRICREWNFTVCSFFACQYIHAYLNCYNDPLSGDSNHQFIYCPKNPNRRQGPPGRPLMGTPHQYPH